MGITLYQLADDYMQALKNSVDEETGEIVNFEALEAIKDEYDHKAVNCALYLKSLKAEAEAIKAEEKTLKDRRTALENNVKRIKQYIEICMAQAGETKIQDTRVTLSIRKTAPSVEIYDEALIPARFFRIKREANKIDIANAIKAGIEVAGAKLTTGYSLQIK